MDDDMLRCSAVSIAANATELLSCVTVTLDWHPEVALRLKLRSTLSHKIDGAAAYYQSACYKMIVFDLLDAFHCQEAFIVSLLKAEHLVCS